MCGGGLARYETIHKAGKCMYARGVYRGGTVVTLVPAACHQGRAGCSIFKEKVEISDF
jgi:hypothetical protein